MSSTARYAEMLSAKRTPFALVAGQLFARQRNWITPVGPAAQRFTLTRSQAREVLAQLGGWWVSWTEGFGAPAANSGWHAVICRQFVPLDKMPEFTAAWKEIGDGEIEVEVEPIPLAYLDLGEGVDGCVEASELITLGELVRE